MFKKIYILLLMIVTGLAVQAQQQCFDFTDLDDPKCTCKYGEWWYVFSTLHQTTNSGKVNGRHNVVIVPQNDPNISSIPQIRPGASSSIHLGDFASAGFLRGHWESIEYNYTPSTTSPPILLFHYAAVMENPSHSAKQQPRIKLEILNQAGNLIDATCGSFDFISSSQGWNTDKRTGYLYKNWTSIGLDLTQYIGQTIKIRVTNYDCAEGAHLGYVYYDIECVEKEIKNESCGLNANYVTLSAPDGFEYKWYQQNGGSPSMPVCTTKDFTLQPNGQWYACDVNQVGKPTCSFTLTAKAEPLYPQAVFAAKTSGTCVTQVNLVNASYVAGLGGVPVSPARGCDSFLWDFGDGRPKSTLANPPAITYTYSGAYTIRLIASIFGGSCNDTMTQEVMVQGEIKSITEAYICEGDQYYFHGQWFSQPGTYFVYDSDDGCVFKYELRLGYNAIFRQEQLSICPNDTVMYHGKVYSQPGIYMDSLTTEEGCIITQLDIGTYPKRASFYYNACHGETILVNERVITQTCVFEDTLISYRGCDSIVRYTYSFNPMYMKQDSAEICEGDVYDFYGQKCRYEGTYRHTFRSKAGCDSVMVLRLKVRPAPVTVERDTFCSTDGYWWRNRWIYEPGIYRDTLRTKYGCDSVLMLDLHPLTGVVTMDLCEGEQTEFGGRVIKEAGIYYDTLFNEHGCDSVTKMVLNVRNKYMFRDTMELCAGDSVEYHGKMLKGAGTHRVRFETPFGCDSIYEMYVIEKPRYHDIAYLTMCGGTPYAWRGRKLTESGTYRDSLRTKAGCDSVFELRLTVHEPNLTERELWMCEGGSVTFSGRTVTAAGVYWDTLSNIHGCDSVVKTVVNECPTYRMSMSATICNGSWYDFRGRSLTAAGVYRDTMRSSCGCDSIFEITLTVLPTYFVIKTDTAYLSATYRWHGRDLTETGVYVDTLRTAEGCDSVTELNLLFMRSYLTTVTVEICRGESYTYKGMVITQPGVYYDSMQTVHGVDSVVRIVVNFKKDYLFDASASICHGGTYTFRGRVLTDGGVYYDSLKTEEGCDSVYRLTLTEDVNYYYIEEDTVCSNGVYHWHGQDITESGIYYDTKRSVGGCDSVYELRLTMFAEYLTEMNVGICHGQAYGYKNRMLTAGVYYDSMLSIHGCDSVVKIVVTEHPKYFFNQSVHICPGGSYDFRGRTLTAEGRYFDSLRTKAGCDSIYCMTLTVDSSYHFVSTDTVCTNMPYRWRNRDLTESGVYFDSLRTLNGCDSVFELRLVLRREKVMEIKETICHGDGYVWKDSLLTRSGVYTDTFVSGGGCDSVVRLYLNVLPTYDLYDTVRICQGERYWFGGKWISTTGSYADSLRTMAGCDSVLHLAVIVGGRFHDMEYVTVCSNEPYLWRGRVLTESGTYFDSLKSESGCDSVFELRLQISMVYETVENVSICEGESYSVRGHVFTKSGVYVDTLRSVYGCDSVVKTILNVLPSYDLYQVVHTCAGVGYWYKGKEIKGGGVYLDSMKTKAGCDSVVHLCVLVDPEYRFDTTVVLCSNQPFEWRGWYYSESGVYYDSLRSVSGCDSVYVLHLDLRQKYTVDVSVSICQGESYRYNGKDYSAKGTYYDTLRSKYGCDSIVRLHVNVLPVYDFYDTVHICQGSQYWFRERYVSAGGAYADSLRSDAGCDSIYHLFVVIDSVYMHTDRVVVCSNEPYYWRGHLLYESGYYDDTVRTHGGCDSIFVLRLDMRPVAGSTVNASICQGESYSFNGQILTAAGTYRATLVSQMGCDSVVELNLNVLPKHNYYDTTHICQGGFVVYHGDTVSTGGTHVKRFMTVGGCDSVYHLFVVVDTAYYNLEYDTVCSNLPYYWHGKSLTVSGTYFDSIRTVNGCDSVFELRLVMRPEYTVDFSVSICQGETYRYNGKNYSAKGTYYDTLRSVYGCDSIVRLHVNVLPKYDFYDTAHICQGGQYWFRKRYVSAGGAYADSLKTVAGCDSVYHLCVLVDPEYRFDTTVVLCSNQPFEWRGWYYSESGVYYDSLRSVSGCDSVYVLHLDLRQKYTVDVSVSICQGETYRYNGKDYSAKGTYYDTLRSKYGCDSVVRLHVNVLPKYDFYDTTRLCQGTQIIYHGDVISAGGPHTHLYKTKTGCDSIYHLFVFVDTAYLFIEADTVPGNVPYLWHGKTLTAAGTYYDSIRTVAGCDSVYELHLTLSDIPVVEYSAMICDGQSYQFGKRLYDKPGTYYDTLISSSGIDSIVKLHLNVMPRYEFYDTTHLCQGSRIVYHGDTISTGGSHTLNFLSAAGCDSTYHLFVVIDTAYYNLEYDTVCSNLPYHWHGKSLTASGTYFDSIRTVNGCDSVFELRLVMRPEYTMDVSVSICQGETYRYNGKNYSAKGTYYDTLRSVYGCDSVVRLHVNVLPKYDFYDTVHICQGSQYWFRERYVSAGGAYADSLKTVAGCDSVYHLCVLVDPEYRFDTTVVVCSNQPFEWRGWYYSESGVYYDSMRSVSGCDSVYVLHLDLRQKYTVDVSVSICQGETYRYNGKNYSAKGTYYDTLRSVYGCDSIVRLHVNVLPVYDFYDTVHICQGSQYWFRERYVSAGGAYADSLKNVAGCDSVYHLFVVIDSVYMHTDRVVVCSNEPYYWRGRLLYESGYYDDTVRTHGGCDSIFVLRLDMRPVAGSTVNASICQGESYSFNGQILTAAGTYRATLVSQMGCDSVVELNLNVLPKHNYYDTTHICQGGFIVYHGDTVSTGGAHVKRFMTAGGCDSVYHLFVVVDTAYYNLEYDTVCSNLPYYWHGKSLTASGTYFDSIRTVNGCDSVFELRLVMRPEYTVDVSVSICQGETYRYNGKNYSAKGTYYDTLRSVYGCDSIMRLHVNVLPKYDFYDTVHICQGSQYWFRERYVSAGGAYADSLKTVAGCDSVYHLCVLVDPEYRFDTTVVVCSNQPFEWRGWYYSESGVYYDSLRSVSGCDSVYVLHLDLRQKYTVDVSVSICQGETYRYNGKNYSAKGTYYDTLRSVYGCDSIVRLHVNVLPVYDFYDTVHICQGSQYWFRERYVSAGGAYADSLKTVAGCDSVYHLFVVIDSVYMHTDRVVVCSNEPYYWRGRLLYESGYYDDTVRTHGGCDSIFVLRLDMRPVAGSTVNASICQGESYSFNGQVLTAAGTYRATLVSQMGCDSVVELNLNVLPKHNYYDTTHICQGGYIVYHGDTVSTGGTHVKRFMTVGGCDSVYHLFVVVDTAYYNLKYDTVCSNLPYYWHGKSLTASGTYFDSIRTVNGCDSVFELRLVMRPEYTVDVSVSICQGETYRYNGKNYSAKGTYYDTLRSVYGCDSIVRLHVNVLPVYDFYDTVHICQGSQYWFRERYVSAGGAYADSLKTVAGCDSVYHLFVVIDSVYMHTDRVVVCSNEPYYWRGRLLYESGYYDDTVKTHGGCDSIFVLRLDMRPVAGSTVNASICQGESYSFNGQILTAAGTYRATLVSQMGCDSVVELNLNVLPKHNYYDTTHICQGGFIVYHGDTVSTGGAYVKRFMTAGGCDSTYHLFVVVDTAYYNLKYDTVCSNLPYYWHGKSLTASGTYFDSIRTVNGCDSVFELRLVMRSVPLREVWASICQGSTYRFNRQDLTVQGIYEDTLISSEGCDSIVRLYLNVFDTYHFRDTVHIFQGGQYVFRGKMVINKGGSYADSLKTTEGCDSIYHLLVIVDSMYKQMIDTSVCTNGSFYWRGRYLDENGTYSDTVRTQGGCDSIFILNLTINPVPETTINKTICQGQSYWFNERHLTVPGVYKDTFVSHTGCDSFVTLILNVLPNYDYYDTLHICQGGMKVYHGDTITAGGSYVKRYSTAGGCDSIYHLFVVVDTTYHYVEYDTVCSNEPYLWHGQAFITSGVYYDHQYSVGGCDSIYELHLEKRATYVTDINASICIGEIYRYNGKDYSAKGTYYDTLASIYGCDSVIKIYVNVLPKYDFYDTVHICDGSQYWFRERYVSAGGSYADSLRSAAGCDSVYHLFVVIDSVYMHTDYVTVCSNEPYRWRGQMLYESGWYDDTVKTQGGCDSIFVLRLDLRTVAETVVNEAICRGESYKFRGEDITVAGIYRDTLVSANGCDSIVELHLNVLPKYDYYDTTYICQGGSVVYHGDTVSTGGAHVKRFMTAGGCDSVYHLTVIVDTVYHYIEYDTVCSNEPYLWHGQAIMASGVYYDRLSSVHGCDSLYELHLEKRQTYVTEQTINICEGQSVTIKKRDVSEAGVYYDTLMSVQGCDSVIKIYVNVLPKYDFYDTVHICDGSQYWFRGRYVSAGGSYADSLRSAAGCDSVYHLFVVIDSVYMHTDYVTVCSNEPYRWRGQMLYESGWYDDTVKTQGGCDSIFVLRLDLRTVAETVVNEAICQGESYRFRKEDITVAGIYRDTMVGANGCDSIIELHLNVLPKYDYYDTTYICQGGSVVYHGDTISTGGAHVKRFMTAGGCDSVYHLTVIVDTVYHYIEYDTVCSNEPYLWHGQSIMASGVYYDRLSSVHGCDSLYELHLEKRQTYVTEQTINICEGQSVTIKKRDVSEAGVYYDTLMSVQGCDSVIKIYVNVLPKYDFYDTVHICDGSQYWFRGRFVSAGGTYADSLRSVAGCDSVYHLFVVIDSVYMHTDYVTVCSNEPYRWRDQMLYESGWYDDTVKTQGGCDSIFVLRLDLRTVAETVVNEAICQGQSYKFRGEDITVAGVYRDTLVGANGCDSIIELHLNVLPKYDYYDTMHICQGGSVVYHGDTVSTGGAHVKRFMTAGGCDSVYHLTVIVDTVYHYIEYDTVCSNEPYLWHGQSIMASGVYYDRLSSVHGCDSLYELHLEKRQTYVTEQTINICEGQSVTIKKRDVSEAGVYYDTLMSVQGCDSVIKIYVNVLPKYDFYDTVHICDGSQYWFRGRYVSAGGSYADSLRSAAGCDSVYHLFVVIDSVYMHTDYVTVCSNEPYRWRGQMLYESGWYDDTVKTQGGCDSIFVLRLDLRTVAETVVNEAICQGQSYKFRGEDITVAGTYRDTLVSANGCDSIIELHLNVLPKYDYYDTTYICQGGFVVYHGDTVSIGGAHVKRFMTAGGCDSVYHLTVIVDTVYHYIEYDTVCSNEPYLWHGQAIMASGVYYDRLSSVHGCDSLYELHLEKRQTYVTEQTINICEGQSVTIKKRDVSEAGVYYDTLMSVQGCDSVIKIYVNVLPKYDFYDTVHICDGSQYWFRERFVSAGGSYADSLRSAAGCDSVYHLFVVIDSVYMHTDYVTVCSNEPYRWRGQMLYESGWYDDTVKTQGGCDSIFVLRLDLRTVAETVVNEAICQGESYKFRGEDITVAGVYRDTMVGANGCDSIVELHLNVLPKYDYYDTVHICRGSMTIYHSDTITSGGSYTKRYQSIGGCDSVYHLTAIIDTVYHFVEYDTICSNQTYKWHGQTIMQSGTYIDRKSSVMGCDSIYELRLTLNRVPLTMVEAEICEGGSYRFNGRDISVAGTYEDTMRTKWGCDSIIRLTLNVMPHYHYYDTVRMCQGEQYMFRGTVITSGGAYEQRHQTAHGCDSVYHLMVIVDSVYHYIEYDTICTNGTYAWRGQSITASGTYIDRHSTVHGCDSTYELRLEVRRPYLTEISASVCRGDVYIFGKRSLTVAGTYEDTLISGGGCDSIVRLYLNVLQNYHYYDTVHICQGGSYDFRGTTITAGGAYADRLQSKDGCDSVYHLFAIVDPSYHYVEWDTVCSNEPYMWHGQSIMQSGTYWDRYSSAAGCDSVYELRLVKREEYITEINASICEGERFVYRGHDYSRMGTYRDTLQSIWGCDSIIKIHVNVLPTYDFHDTVHICQGSQYWFRNRYVSAGGVYADSLRTEAGCDSVYHLMVVIDSLYMESQNVSVCQNEPCYWRGRYYTKSGTYRDTVKSVEGCDSVFVLRLRINPVPLTEIKVDICEGERYRFKGEDLGVQGVYEDTLISAGGCDSVVRLYLNILQNYDIYDTVHVCQGSEYWFRGRSVKTAGWFADSLRSKDGCDSIYHLLVIVDTVYHQIEYDTVCSSAPYVWRGQTIRQSGTYWDRYNSVAGCDSIYELRLHYGKRYITERTLSICQGQHYYFRGRDISAQGVYYDTLQSVQGCDSVVKLFLNVYPTYQHVDTVRICNGDYYNFRGRMVQCPGVYWDSLRTVEHGCDSIYRLVLLAAPTYRFVTTDTTCSNYPYMWRGRYYYGTGVYRDTLVTTAGCDSIYELRLTVDESYQTDRFVSLCKGETFIYKGRDMSAQGVYWDSLRSTKGCDSVIRFVVSIMPTYMFRDTVRLCRGGEYDFRGRLITSPGVYQDTLKTVCCGCDSVFEVNVLPAVMYHHVDNDTVCTNGTYQWRGKYYTESGTYWDSLISRDGCDSVYELRLTVYEIPMTTQYETVCMGESIRFNGQTITQPGTYYDTLARSGEGCDSIIKLVVSVSASYLYEQTAHICQGSSYMFRGRRVSRAGVYYDSLRTVGYGCDSIYKLTLKIHYANSSLIDTVACRNDVFTFGGRIITQPGIYVDTLRTEYGCDSISELHIRFADATHSMMSATICPREVFTTPSGKRLNQTGVYYDTLVNRAGCDSVIEIRLNVVYGVLVYDTATIVKGQTYYYHGKGYTTAGTHRDTGRSVLGCDTVFCLTLYLTEYHTRIDTTVCGNHPFVFRERIYTVTTKDTLYLPGRSASVPDTVLYISVTVIPYAETLIADSTCDGKPYHFGGRTLTETGVYRDTMATVQGCDSIIILTLTVRERVDSVTEDTICDGESYVWRGRSLTVQGHYRDTILNVQTGCNIYYDLLLTVTPKTVIIKANDHVNSVSMCGDEQTYEIFPTFTGTPPTRFSIRYDGVVVPSTNDVTDAEYDGVSIVMPIPRDASNQPMRPDHYRVNLEITNDKCGNSPSSVDFDLLVKYPSAVLEQHFNDVVSVLNSEYNGGYNFVAFKWYVNDVPMSTGSSNLYLTTLAPRDTVYAELMREGENYYIPTCPLEVRNLGAEPQEYPVILKGTYYAPGKTTAVVVSRERGIYQLYDMMGKMLQQGDISEEYENNIDVPYVAGCYLLTVRTSRAGLTVFKIVVR